MTVYRYTCAFGVFDVPADVLARSIRLGYRFGRTTYLEEWCCWQWQRGAD